MKRNVLLVLGAAAVAAPLFPSALADPLPPGGKGVSFKAPQDGRFKLWWTIDDFKVGGNDAPPAVDVDLKKGNTSGPHKPVNEAVNDYHYSFHFDENLQLTLTDVQSHAFDGFDAMSELVSDFTELYTLFDVGGQDLNVDVDLLEWWTAYDAMGAPPLEEQTSFLVAGGLVPELPGFMVFGPGSDPFTGEVTAYGGSFFNFVPAPGSGALLACGLTLLARRRR